jgi:hypothetical protein
MNAIDVIAAVAMMNRCVAGSCRMGRSVTPLGVHGNPSIEYCGVPHSRANRMAPRPQSLVRGTSQTLLHIETRVLEVEVAEHRHHHVVADHAVAPELDDRATFRVEQLAPQALIALRLLLDRAVALGIEP